MGVGPRLFTGKEINHCGKIALTEITGGTEGSSKVYEKMAQVGIGTVVAMHMSEKNRKEAEKADLHRQTAVRRGNQDNRRQRQPAGDRGLR